MHLLLCYLKQISNATWNNYNTESKDSNTVCRNVRYFTARNVFITRSNVLKNISTFQRLKKIVPLFYIYAGATFHNQSPSNQPTIETHT